MRTNLHILLLLPILAGCGDLFDPDDFLLIPPFEELDFSQIQPGVPSDYWELRHGPEDAPHDVLAAGGPVKKTDLPKDLQDELEQLVSPIGFGPCDDSGYGKYYIVHVFEDDVCWLTGAAISNSSWV